VEVIQVKICSNWKAFFVLFLTNLAALAWGDEALVGTVKTAHGGATILRGEVTMPIQAGVHLHLNDTLRTAADGGIGVILQDGTRLSLGPGTELTIDRFVYQPADGKFSLLLQLAKGALAYVSGKIALLSPGAASVETPVGILGLRGTEFVILVEEPARNSIKGAP
jgi:hypothetical protein